MLKPEAMYTAVNRVRVVCPDCGAGGANSGPCYCHKCNYDVMMLPEAADGITYNWLECVVRQPTR